MFAWLKRKLYVSSASSSVPMQPIVRDPERPPFIQPAVKVVMLHFGTTGQSCMLRRIVDNRYSPHLMATIGINFATMSTEQYKYQIWDTSGQERFHSISTAYLRQTSMVLLTFDLTDRPSFDNLQRLKHEAERGAPDAPIILVGNRCDLEDKRKVAHKEAEAMARRLGAKQYIEFSAKEDIGVSELLGALDQVHTQRLDDDVKRADMQAIEDQKNQLIQVQAYIKQIQADKASYLNVRMFQPSTNILAVLKGLSLDEDKLILEQQAQLFLCKHRRQFLRKLNDKLSDVDQYDDASKKDRENCSQLVRRFVVNKQIKWRSCPAATKQLIHLDIASKWRKKPTLIKMTDGFIIALDEAVAVLAKKPGCLQVNFNATDIDLINKYLGKTKRYCKQCVIEIDNEYQLIDLSKLNLKQKHRFVCPDNIKHKISHLMKKHRHMGRYKVALETAYFVRSLLVNKEQFPVGSPLPDRLLITDDNYGIDVDTLLADYAGWQFLENPYTKQPFSHADQEQLLRFCSDRERAVVPQKLWFRDQLRNRDSLPVTTTAEQVVYVSDANDNSYCFDVNWLVSYCVDNRRLTYPDSQSELSDTTLLALSRYPRVWGNQQFQALLDLKRRLQRAVNKSQFLSPDRSVKGVPPEDVVLIDHEDRSAYAFSKQECIAYVEHTVDFLSPYNQQRFSTAGIDELKNICLEAKRYDLVRRILVWPELQGCVNKEFTAGRRLIKDILPFDLIITEDNYACSRHELLLKKNPNTGLALTESDRAQLRACSAALMDLQHCSNGDEIRRSVRFLTIRPWEEVVVLDVDHDGVKGPVAYICHELRDSVEKTGCLPDTNRPITAEQATEMLRYRLHRGGSEAGSFELADIANHSTLLGMPLFCVPVSALFLTTDRPAYGFDVNELVSDLESNKRLMNSYTRSFFTREDQQILCKYAKLRSKVLNLIAKVNAQQNSVQQATINMVKEFAVKYYFNESNKRSFPHMLRSDLQAMNSGVALTDFKCALNEIPREERDLLYDYLIIDNDKVLTFGELMREIEGGAICAHMTSRMLWKFINDFDGGYIKRCLSKDYAYGYADIGQWQDRWARESSTNVQRIKCLGIDEDVWCDRRMCSSSRFFNDAVAHVDSTPDAGLALDHVLT